MNEQVNNIVDAQVKEIESNLDAAYQMASKARFLDTESSNTLFDIEQLSNNLSKKLYSLRNILGSDVSSEVDIESINSILFDQNKIIEIATDIDTLKNIVIEFSKTTKLNCITDINKQLTPTYEQQNTSSSHWTELLRNQPRMIIVHFINGYLTALRFGELGILKTIEEK